MKKIQIRLKQTYNISLIIYSHSNLFILLLFFRCNEICLNRFVPNYNKRVTRLTSTLNTSPLTQDRSGTQSFIATPIPPSRAHKSDIPPGRSVTVTLNLTRRFSDASPRSKQRESIVRSILPPDRMQTTLKTFWFSVYFCTRQERLKRRIFPSRPIGFIHQWVPKEFMFTSLHTFVTLVAIVARR